jgi:FixJ family two-component response regulator
VDKADLSNCRTSTLVLFVERPFHGSMAHRFVEAPAPARFAYSLWNEWLTKTPLISIVDDDDTVRAATESLVRSLGFEARTFASAESFLQSSALSKTRCLILDVQMPNMSGIELQDRLSQLGFEIPIIFMTAYPDEAVRQRALQAGAVGVLLKPFDVHGQRFVDCLREALKQHKGSAP